MWISGLLLPAALAWEPTGTSWAWQDDPIEDTLRLDPGSFPSDAGGSAEVEAALGAALDTWTALGYNLTFRYTSTSGASLNSEGLFHVFYSADYLTDSALAFTAAWTWEDGAAFDCDIVFLEENTAVGTILWDADPAGPSSGRFDVEAVALHEAGHCLGLGHSASGSAVMYAYYQGYRALDSDDIAGAESLHGLPCADGDGDGVSACAGDCDDSNAAIFPGAAEVCDGVDGDCDGVVDQQSEREIPLARLSSRTSTSWASLGNTFRVDSPTALLRWDARVQVAEGARLVWVLAVADDPAGPWEVLRTEISLAGADAWNQSPTFNHPLEEGRVYAAALGALGTTMVVWYDGSAALSPDGPLTPLGGVVGRALGDNLGAADPSTLFEQTLVVVDLPDPDGDGVTALCGDCAPEDAAVATGLPELCDGVDQDCDGAVDEDFAVDTDGDGAYDCADPCPEDALDDRDGDGACDGADPCPEDALDACAQDSPCAEGCDSGGLDSSPTPLDPDEADGKGVCGAVGGGAAWWALGLVLLLRRQRAQTVA